MVIYGDNSCDGVWGGDRGEHHCWHITLPVLQHTCADTHTDTHIVSAKYSSPLTLGTTIFSRDKKDY